jgi:hypothetical protein
MSGRVIHEGLQGGPAISSVRVERLQQTVKTGDGSYELTAYLSIVDAAATSITPRSGGDSDPPLPLRTRARPPERRHCQ